MQTDDDATPNQASAKRSLSFQEAKPLLKIAEVPKLQNIEDQSDESLKNEDDRNTNENQNGDSMKKEDNNENPNSTRRSLSFVLPCVDDQNPLMDVQVLSDLELPKQDEQEHSCGYISDDLPIVQEGTGQDSKLDTRPVESETRPVSYLLPMDDQTPLMDVQVVSNLELPEQDEQEHSGAQISGDLPIIQERGEQNSNLDTRPVESETLVVEAQNQIKPVTSRVTRSKRKVALEPNPDSIGGRLRQRRKS